jgi:hypothetical protein
MTEALPEVYLARHGNTAWRAFHSRLDCSLAGAWSGPRRQILSSESPSLSALSYEHDLSRPVIRLWNDDHHVIAETTQSSKRKLKAAS